jgi:type II secretory pathway pseudopilin PulG
MQQNINKKLSAFSLIEMLVAIGIITMIVSVGFYAFTSVIKNNYQSQELGNDMKFFEVAFREFYQKYQGADIPSNLCDTEVSIIEDADLISYATTNHISVVCNKVKPTPAACSSRNYQGCARYKINMRKNGNNYAATKYVYSFIK